MRVNIGIPVVRTDGLRAVYGHVITNFFGIGRFTYPWYSSSPLARFARGAPLILRNKANISLTERLLVLTMVVLKMLIIQCKDNNY